MMQQMTAYTTELLRTIGVFLGSEPMIYLFGVVVACFIVKMMLSIIKWR